MHEYTSGVARISNLEGDIQQKFTKQILFEKYLKMYIKFSKIFQEYNFTKI